MHLINGDLVSAEELHAAASFLPSYHAREHAYAVVLPYLTPAQINRIEGIWATSIVSAELIAGYLYHNGLFQYDEARLRANAFVWVRLGPLSDTNF